MPPSVADKRDLWLTSITPSSSCLEYCLPLRRRLSPLSSSFFVSRFYQKGHILYQAIPHKSLMERGLCKGFFKEIEEDSPIRMIENVLRGMNSHLPVPPRHPSTLPPFRPGNDWKVDHSSSASQPPFDLSLPTAWKTVKFHRPVVASPVSP